ncbi:hypothetical protein EXW49_29260 (plasmid) [Bacillus mycoides]|nr:hypothetical protein EXW49_29260 [Bacillus mycoides]
MQFQMSDPINKKKIKLSGLLYHHYKGVLLHVKVQLVIPYVHQVKVLMYPLNENFLSLQLVILRSQLIFSFLGCLLFFS